MLAFWNKFKLEIVIGLAVSLGIVCSIGMFEYRERVIAQANAESTLAAAQAGLKLALADATRRDKLIVALTARADSAGKVAAVSAQHAKTLADSMPHLKSRLDSVLTDSSQKQAANALYAAENARADSLAAVITAQTNQIGAISQALDSAKVSVKTTTQAAVAVDTAATAVVKSTKLGFFEKITPRAGIGAAAGLDLTGRPTVVIGVTLSWPR